MRILFDEQIFSNQRFGGISRYYTELVKALGETKKTNAKILSPLCTNHYVKNIPGSYRIGVPFPAIPWGGKYVWYFNKMAADWCIDRFKPDILHQTYYPNKDPLRRPGVRVVTTIHDMIHELFPNDFPESREVSERKLRAVRNADLVICVSENTRKDLVRISGVEPAKTAVIHHGVDHIQSSPLPAFQSQPKPYLLYVGLRTGYKNFQGVLKAYAANPDLMSRFDLICFGGGELTELEKTRIAQLNIPGDKIIATGGDDTALSRYYQHAGAFLYPSLYEGFGIPPLEAMMQGCPVISSNVSSLPEVLGNAVEYFNPHNVDDMVNAINRVVEHRERSDELRTLGFSQAQKFTWRKCAEQTLSHYKGLLN